MREDIPRGTLLPKPSRREPDQYYACTSKSATYSNTTRVLGIWVPGAAFRRGTLIRIGLSGSSTIINLVLSIGGNASARALGTTRTITASPAATCGGYLTYQQETDGIQPTFRTGGWWSGAISVIVSQASSAMNIQPMNFVEVSTSTTEDITWLMLEVIPPQRLTQFGYQEIAA